MSVHVNNFNVISLQDYSLDDLYNMLVGAYNAVSCKSDDLFTYLSMAVHINNGSTVTISQPAYIEKMLFIAGMEECSPSQSPMGIDQSENDSQGYIGVDEINYLRLVGLINYLASYACPDLLYRG